MIFVYGRDGCNLCEQTRKLFDRWKITYKYLDVDDYDDLKLILSIDNCATLPITVVDGETICGFQYEKFKTLKVSHGGEGV